MADTNNAAVPRLWFTGDTRYNAGEVWAWAGEGEGTAKIRPVAMGEGGPVHQVSRAKLEPMDESKRPS